MSLVFLNANKSTSYDLMPNFFRGGRVMVKLQLNKRSNHWVSFYVSPFIHILMSLFVSWFLFIAISDESEVIPLYLYFFIIVYLLYSLVKTFEVLQKTWIRYRREKKLILYGERTIGEISEIKKLWVPVKYAGPKPVKVKFKFNAGDGKLLERSIRLDTQYLSILDKGSKITVFYNKANPRLAIIYETSFFINPLMKDLNKNVPNEVNRGIPLSQLMKDSPGLGVITIILIGFAVIMGISGVGCILYFAYTYFSIKYGFGN